MHFQILLSQYILESICIKEFSSKSNDEEGRGYGNFEAVYDAVILHPL